MASNHDDEPAGLPITWPFTFGALLITASMVWFCGHFAVRDPLNQKVGFKHAFPVFWSLIVAGIVVIWAIDLKRGMELKLWEACLGRLRPPEVGEPQAAWPAASFP